MLHKYLLILIFVLLSSPINLSADKLVGEASFKATEYDFGSFRQGIVRRVVFVFTNTGKRFCCHPVCISGMWLYCCHIF